MVRRKRKGLTLQVEAGKQRLSTKDLKDIFIYLFRWEPVILGIMLADAARFRRRIKAYINAVKLLELAVLPPNLPLDIDLVGACFEAIIESLPEEDVNFIMEFMAGYLAECQPIPTWRDVAKPLKK